MTLTNKQEQGLKLAVERFKNKEAYTCIAGYAGTGKSTLVKFIVSALNLDPEHVCYIAYTGKASLVLKSKGCENAMTAHKLLYKSYQGADGRYYHTPWPMIKDYKLIIVDEISMLPKQMWDLLLTHKIPVIALGDPGQLPPIGESNGVLDYPHVFLDEIMRQAQESEIIRLTMAIRDHKPLMPYSGNEVRIIEQGDVVSGLYTWADQIIAGRNTTRHQVNRLMRNYVHGLDFDAKPIEGDKIICLKNDWKCSSQMGDVLINGSMGTLANVSFWPNKQIGTTMMGDFYPEEYDMDFSYPQDPGFRMLKMDYKLFMEQVPTVNRENFKKISIFNRPREFDYGYCITCHKSQGSEYDKVVVLEECLHKSTHANWLYTAATRAKEKLVIVKEK